MKIEKVLIIGGGIGGLTLGLALQKAGIPFEIFERAPELKEVGAGVGLWANAVRVLDRLGLGEKIRAIGQPLQFGEIAGSKGQVLSRTDISQLTDEMQAACYVVHRAELHAVLAKNLPANLVKTDHECIGIQENTVKFKNQPDAAGTLIVGADGINSVVRKHLWGNESPRYSAQTCFRSVIDFSHSDTNALREVQGAGKRFGICPLGKNRIYWFAALNAPQGKMIPFAERKQFLLEEYKDWAWQIPEMIAAADSEKILQNDLIDRLPLKKWSKDAITLLGDAAHPTTPNLGQGACMAIEDAMVLTRKLMEFENLSDALQSFENERIPRTTLIVKRSWNFGKMAKWKNPLAVGLREFVVKTTPDSVMQKTLRQQIDYDAGNLF